MFGIVKALARSTLHGFSKSPVDRLDLLAGIGVENDAHAGRTVQHLSRLAVDPTQPNLRQVHLLHAELLEELATEGFAVAPGQLGENVLTCGIDLLGLPRGAVLVLGPHAQVEITGLRNPCKQIEAYRPGLLARLARRLPDGGIERLAGIMGVVRASGAVTVGEAIAVRLPAPPYVALGPV